MDEHVAVAVRDETDVRRDFHPREKNEILRFAERMGVDADARPGEPVGKILGIGEFLIVARAFAQPGRGDERRIYGGIVRIFAAARQGFSVGAEQFFCKESLRGLHGIRPVSGGHGGDGPVFVREGHGVHGRHGADAAAESFYASDAVFDAAAGDEGTCAVVDEHDIAAVFSERAEDRLRAGGAARNDAHLRETRKQPGNFLPVFLGSRDENFFDAREIERGNRPFQHGASADGNEEFVFGKTRPFPLAGGADDRADGEGARAHWGMTS